MRLGWLRCPALSCWATANSFLVLVRHKTLHGVISMLPQLTKPVGNPAAGKLGEIKHKDGNLLIPGGQLG